MKMIKCFLLLLFIYMLSGCALDKLAINKVADILSQDGGTVFTGDADPQLIGEALPFSLKLYESLLDSAPRHTKLLLATGKAFCLYAYAYVQLPAEMLTDDELALKDTMLTRAKNLFLRGKQYIAKAIDIRIPGFNTNLAKKELTKALKLTTVTDVPYVYWFAAAGLGAFTTDPFDMELLLNTSIAVALIERCLELNPAYEMGSGYEVLVSYYGALPESMGGSEEKARAYFEKAISYSQGKKADPYMNLATSVCIKKQKIEEFRKLLNIVIKIDLNASPENRLMNAIAQKKATWMLKNIDNWFLTGDEEVIDDNMEDYDIIEDFNIKGDNGL